jgi:CO/xanthine dehydrogenase Mo-binding subunit
VAAVVEVAVDDKGAMTIPRVDIAVDCGATVNPDRMRAQMEGACIMGLGIATSGEMSFKAGRAEQGNLNTYEVTRITGAPREIRVHILPATTTCRWAAWASPACRRSHRRCATRSSPPPASASGVCRSATS